MEIRVSPSNRNGLDAFAKNFQGDIDNNKTSEPPLQREGEQESLILFRSKPAHEWFPLQCETFETIAALAEQRDCSALEQGPALAGDY